jgi:hypothetical protein
MGDWPKRTVFCYIPQECGQGVKESEHSKGLFFKYSSENIALSS